MFPDGLEVRWVELLR